MTAPLRPDPRDAAATYDQLRATVGKILDDLVSRDAILSYAPDANGGWIAQLPGDGGVVRLDHIGEAIVFAVGVATGLRLAGAGW